jgi:hypothetical protein
MPSYRNKPTVLQTYVHGTAFPGWKAGARFRGHPSKWSMRVTGMIAVCLRLPFVAHFGEHILAVGCGRIFQTWVSIGSWSCYRGAPHCGTPHCGAKSAQSGSLNAFVSKRPLVFKTLYIGGHMYGHIWIYAICSICGHMWTTVLARLALYAESSRASILILS